MKAVHLTSVHPTDDIRVFHRECRTLAAAGYDVAIIAPSDNARTEHGVRIVAVPRARGRFERMTATVLRIYRAAIREEADIYHFHDPELIPLGLLLKLRGKRVVYDVHEDVPRQIHNKTWIPSWIKPILSLCISAVEAVATAVFDGVITATPTIAKRFPQSKTAVVRNYPVSSEWSSGPGAPYRERGNTIAYIGSISLARGWKEMKAALSALPAKLNVTLAIAGPTESETLEAEIRSAASAGGIEYFPWLDRSGIAALLHRSRLGLVVLHPLECYIDALPIKLFEYMSAGLPVVASHFPLWKEIIDDARCGLSVDPLKTEDIASAVAWLLNNPQEAEAMGLRGKTAVLEKYNWEHEARTLQAFYKKLLEF